MALLEEQVLESLRRENKHMLETASERNAGVIEF